MNVAAANGFAHVARPEEARTRASGGERDGQSAVAVHCVDAAEPGRTAPIIAARTAPQPNDNLGALDVPFSPRPAATAGSPATWLGFPARFPEPPMT